jgi:hypothetical protein
MLCFVYLWFLDGNVRCRTLPTQNKRGPILTFSECDGKEGSNVPVPMVGRELAIFGQNHEGKSRIYDPTGW